LNKQKSSFTGKYSVGHLMPDQQLTTTGWTNPALNASSGSLKN
jgi:hypothetical protein